MSASSPANKGLKIKGPTTQVLQKTLSKAMATARVQTLFVPAFRLMRKSVAAFGLRLKKVLNPKY
ncbi:hypothetical protein AYI88_15195 [Shewanella algae]|nr:hypothetical protein AYI88_15195 [Shewanella algae]TVK92271.1 hypothetical protein AYJ01_16315 [Shewanella algae]